MTKAKWNSATLAKALLIAGLGGLTSTSVQAQEPAHSLLKPCEQANVRLHDLAIGSDGSGVQTYYQGNVLIVRIDQVEPAAMSSGIVILAMMPDSQMGERICMAATHFSYLDLDAAKSSYDESNGLTLAIPAMDYSAETGMSVPGKPLNVSINLGEGKMSATR